MYRILETTAMPFFIFKKNNKKKIQKKLGRMNLIFISFLVFKIVCPENIFVHYSAFLLIQKSSYACMNQNNLVFKQLLK